MKRIIVATALVMATGSSLHAAEHYFQDAYTAAGRRYNIAPQLLEGISIHESGKNPLAVNWNSNGSYDFGVMQINSIWEPTLRKLGIDWNSLADPYTNIMTGAWILRQCMDKYGENWKAVGCYNSQTPSKRDRYARQIASTLVRHNLLTASAQLGR